MEAPSSEDPQIETEGRTGFHLSDHDRRDIARHFVLSLASKEGEEARRALAGSMRDLFLQELYTDTGKTAWRILRLLAWSLVVVILGWLGLHGGLPKE